MVLLTIVGIGYFCCIGAWLVGAIRTEKYILTPADRRKELALKKKND